MGNTQNMNNQEIEESYFSVKQGGNNSEYQVEETPYSDKFGKF